MPTKEQMEKVTKTLKEAMEREKERLESQPEEERTPPHQYIPGRIGVWHPKIYRSEYRGD